MAAAAIDQFAFAGIGIDDGEGERVVASNVTDRIRHLQSILQRTGEEEAAIIALAASGSRDDDDDDAASEGDEALITTTTNNTDYKLPGRPTTAMGPSKDNGGNLGGTSTPPPATAIGTSSIGGGRGSRRAHAAQLSGTFVLAGGSGARGSPTGGGVAAFSSSPVGANGSKPATPPHVRVPSTATGSRPSLATSSPAHANGTSTPPAPVPLYGRRGRPTVTTPPATATLTAPMTVSPLAAAVIDEGKRSAEDEELVALMNDDSKEIAQREMKYVAGTTPPLVSGWLLMQKSTGKWKKLLCSYSDGCLHYKGMDEGKRRMVGSIKAAFCEAELNTAKVATVASSIAAANGSGPAGSPTGATALTPGGSNGTTGNAATANGGNGTGLAVNTSGAMMLIPVPAGSGSPTNGGALGPNTKFDDLYWSYLESQEASHAFKLFSPNRLYIFRADTDELRNQFVDVIRKELQSSMSEQLWQDKCDAMKEFNPLLREQFILQVNRYNALVKSLAKSGFMEDDLPITSTRKEKSGVLCMETPHDFTKWRDYYFVLFEGSLFYYKDSKSTTPTGFVTLRFASVHLDTKRLARGEYVFHVKTPLRTVACKTKHAVALSEWIACLENALNGTGKGKSSKKSSLKVLQDINKLLADVSTVESLMEHPVALQYFKKYLIDETKSSNELDFYLKAEELANNDELQPAELKERATLLYDTYIRDDAKERLMDLPKAARADIESKLSSPTATLYKECCKLVYIKLSAYFNAFKRTDGFRSLNALLNKTTVSDKREVSPFDGTHLQSFVLKVKGSKRSKDIKFNKKSNVFTIGRDKSNNLVIEDSRVSRSHARVEYTDTQCEYIDLGSSCGSKLNGKPVLRAKLQPGDVIELGQSTLIFQVKPKRRFSLFG